ARSSRRARTADVVSLTARVLGEAHAVEAALDRAKGHAIAAAVADMRAQLSALIFPGFVAETGARRLGDLVRYLRGIAHRLEKAPADIRPHASRMGRVKRLPDDSA